jgi:hypothetical protein
MNRARFLLPPPAWGHRCKEREKPCIGRAEESHCGTERPHIGAQARHVASFAVSRPTLAARGEERERGRDVGQVGKKGIPGEARVKGRVPVRVAAGQCNQVQRAAFKPARGGAFEGTRLAPFL